MGRLSLFHNDISKIYGYELLREVILTNIYFLFFPFNTFLDQLPTPISVSSIFEKSYF